MISWSTNTLIKYNKRLRKDPDGISKPKKSAHWKVEKLGQRFGLGGYN